MDFGRSLATHRDLESKVRMEDKQKPCPECGAEIPCGVMECPICGHVFKGPERAAPGEVGSDDPEVVSNEMCIRDRNIPDFNSLIAISQQHSKPICALTDEEIATTGKVFGHAKKTMIASRDNFLSIFNELAYRIITLTS